MEVKTKNRIYFIYKYTFPNGKVYIGQTYKGSNRFGNHIEYHKQPVHFAMLKYPDYKKEILEYCSIDEVDEREQFYIALYHSMEKPFGYNLTSGGNKNKQWAPEVRQRIIEKLKNPSEETRRKMSARSAGSRNPMYGIHRKLAENPHSKPISLYDLSGNKLREFDCIKRAVIELELPKYASSQIVANCRGKILSAHGFIWRYTEDKEPVLAYKRKTTKGFKHSDESKEKMRKSRLGKIGGPRAKAVLQYDLDGNFIQEFISANNADVRLKLSRGNVYSACIGKKKSVGGFMWRFKTENYPIKIHSYSTNQFKPVKQLDLEGKLIREWGSAAEAGKELHINPSNISNACSGKVASAGGFKWKR